MSRARAGLLLAPALLLFGAPALSLYEDRPPPAHTGGFGEPSCADCHFDNPVDAAGGALVLEGLPADGFSPGGAYTLIVRLAHPELRRGGFQLSARFAGGPRTGEQAGTLRALDPRVFVARQGGMEYAGHGPEGTPPTAAGSAAWRLEWTAPAEPVEVVFHLAANAANGDASQFGDYVYLLESRHRPAPRSPSR